MTMLKIRHFCIFVVCVNFLFASQLYGQEQQWDGTFPNVNTNFSGGDGSSENPYQINTATDLALLSVMVNNSTNPILRGSGKYFKLMVDIDLNYQNWKPIGTSTWNSFLGTFDGNGKTISNLSMSSDNTISLAALFGAITDGGAVLNLNVANVKLEKVKASNMAAVVAYLSGTVTNCSVSGFLSNESGYTGGIVAYLLSGSITHCKNMANLKTKEKFLGGIVAYNMENGSISNCYNTGNLEITDNANQPRIVGGICGENKGLIEKCFNMGNIIAKKMEHRAGGIAGVNRNKIAYTYNIGRFLNVGQGQRSPFLGGLVGHNLTDDMNLAILEYSYHLGFMEREGAANGAIVGTNGTNCIVRNCFVDRQIDTNQRLVALGSLQNCMRLPTKDIVGMNLSNPQKLYNLGEPSNWVFEHNKYPRIADIAVDDWVNLSVAPFILFDGDNCWSVTSNFFVDTVYGVRWSSSDPSKIEISGDTADLKFDCTEKVDVTITAVLGEASKIGTIHGDIAKAGAIYTTGQTIESRNEIIHSIQSEILPSGGYYQWEVSTDNGLTFQEIPMATKLNYTPIQNTNGTYIFRRWVSVPRCNFKELSQGTWKLVLNYNVTITEQPKSDTICYEDIAALKIAIVANEGTEIQYRWQILQGERWEDLPNGNTEKYIFKGTIAGEHSFRCLISDDAGITSLFTSNIAVIKVLEPFTFLAYPLVPNVCKGQDVTFFARASGGIGNYTYQWRSRSQFENDFTNIPGANDSIYVFKPLGNIYVQCVITDALCGSDTTLQDRVTVYGDETPGRINSGVHHVCYNYVPYEIANIESPSNDSAICQWQLSIDGGKTFSDIPEATQKTYIPTIRTPEGMYVYRRMIKDDFCYSDWTSSYGIDTIIINKSFIASAKVTSDYNGIQISHKGAADGRIEVVLTDSSVHTPYAYLWSPTTGNTREFITNAGEGIHNVKITDTLGCIATASTEVKYTELIPDLVADTLRFYVTGKGKGNRSGINWENALPGNLLQDALNNLDTRINDPNKQTSLVGEVWLGIGLDAFREDSTCFIFTPSQLSPFAQANSKNVRDRSFVIPSGVSLYGGFIGNEGKKIEREARLENRLYTVLSGKMPSGEKVYNVLVFGNGISPLPKPSIVDGILISSGNANSTGSNSSQKRGGGMIMVGNSIFRSGIVSECSASQNGGGVYMLPGSHFISSIVERCSALRGGGIYTAQTASNIGSESTRANILMSTIVNNKATESGAGCYLNEYVSMHGSVFWNNTINSISRNNNIKLSSNNGINPDYGYNDQKYSFSYLYANDDFVGVYGLLPFVLDDINKANRGPNFLDPRNDNGLINPIFLGAFQLDSISPLIRSTPTEIINESDLLKYKIDILDVGGRKRLVGALDIGALEYQKDVVIEPTANRIYVSNRLRGKGDGSSWDNATNSLQKALNYFAEKTPPPGVRFEIWLSGGTYYPSSLSEFGFINRNLSYTLKGYTNIYGGFTGVAGTEGVLNESTRPRTDLNKNGLIEAWEFTNTTILSGEINTSGVQNTNAYHVIYRDNTNTLTGYNVILDGLMITKGNADGDDHDSRGSGIYALNPITIRNCAFDLNYGKSKTQGIAIYAKQGVNIENSYIARNESDISNDTAAAIYLENGGTFTQCIIAQNQMIGLYASSGSLAIQQSTIAHNTVGIKGSVGEMINTVVWGNEKDQIIGTPTMATYNAVEGRLLSGMGNIRLASSNTDNDGPNFMKVTMPYAYYPYCKSALLDKATVISGIDKDITNRSRKHQGFVDIGAYENQIDSLIVGAIASTGNVICYNTVSKVNIPSLINASGGTPPLRYHWEANGELIKNSNFANLTPSDTLRESTIFRRFVSDSGCNNGRQSDGEWTVTVYPKLTAKQRGKDTILCHNTSAFLRVDVAGGSGKYNYKWQIAPDNKAFVDITDIESTSDSILIPPKETTYYIRCKIFDIDCNTIYSDTLRIDIYKEFEAGAIDTVGETICLGMDKKRITESKMPSGGVSPHTYTWYLDDQPIKSEASKAKEYTPYATQPGVYIYTRFVRDSICQTTPIQSVGQWKLSILKRPSVRIMGDTTIAYGQFVELKLFFDGTPPFSYRLSGETIDRISDQTNAVVRVSPDKSMDYAITALSDATVCSARSENLLGTARVNIYCQVETELITGNSGFIQAFDKKSGNLITRESKLEKFDTVLVKMKPASQYYLKHKDGLLYNGKDSTEWVFAAYTEEILTYMFLIKENVLLSADFQKISPWNATVEQPFTSALGDSLLIYTPSELAWLASESMRGVQFRGASVKLLNDLDLGGSLGANFKPIGNTENAFRAHFDGNAKNIHNLRVVYPTALSNVGLFGNIGREARIENFQILDGIVSSNLDYVGAIAGRCNGVIDRVYNYANVSGGKNYVGGLVGNLSELGKITNSYNAGGVEATLAAGTCVGGLVGQNMGAQISHSFNIGNVKGGTKVGGLVGEALSASIVEYCYNMGEVLGNSNVCGLIGVNFSDKIQYVYNGGGFILRPMTILEGTRPLSVKCYTDTIMITAPTSEIIGITLKNTSDMIGDGLKTSLGLAENWIFEENLYPQLASINTDLGKEASIVSVTPVFIANKERKNAIKSDFTYANANGVTWTSSSAAMRDPVTINNGKATVSRSCAEDLMDTLRITKGISSRIITVQVLKYSDFTPGKIAIEGEDICFGVNPQIINEVESPQGNESDVYTYSWYKNGVKIDGAESASYTPSDSVAGSYVYRRKVSEANCNPTGSFSNGIWSLTIKPDLILTKYTENNTVCYGTGMDLVFLVSGGDGNYTYKWEQSEDNNIWEPAVGAKDSIVYTTPNLMKKTYYRCKVNSCGIEKTLSGFVNVYAPFKAGAIKDTTENLCYGKQGALIKEITPAEGGLPPYVHRWIQISGNTNTSLGTTTKEFLPLISYPISKDTSVIYVREVRDSKCAAFTRSEGESKYVTYPELKAELAITSDYFGLPLSDVNANDASLAVSVSGGSKNYTYTWQKNGRPMIQTTSQLTDLGPGNYTVTVNSSINGVNLSCPVSKTIKIDSITFTPKVVNTDTLRLYVTYNGSGTKKGNSWENAIPNTLLQAAMDQLAIQGKDPLKGAEIWLGVGMNSEGENSGTAFFYPRKRSPYVKDDLDPRAKSFVLPEGVNIFGAFYGNENNKNERTERSNIRTILSGYFTEKDRLATNQNRVYNVLVFGDGNTPLAKPTMIDAISLMHGKADHASILELQQGGGTSLVKNAIMRNGYAGRNYAIRGGGIHLKEGGWVTNSIFVRDTAKQGAGIYVEDIQNGNINDPSKRANIVGVSVIQCEAIDGTSNIIGGSAGIRLNQYVFMANTVIWDNRYNGVSYNNNVKMESPYDIATHLFEYVAYNDTMKGEEITEEILLKDENEEPLAFTMSQMDESGEDNEGSGGDDGAILNRRQYPQFSDPYHVSAMTINGFGLKATSPLKLISASTVTKPEDLNTYNLDIFDYAGHLRLVGNAMDIGAFESPDTLRLKPTNNRLYVSRYPKGLRDGSSWENASNSIQFALDYFAKQELPQGLAFFEIWISEGEYIPTAYYGENTNDPIYKTFILNDKTNIYGGFLGHETNIEERQHKDIIENGIPEKWSFEGSTILSGEIWVATSGKQYVRHVVFRPASVNPKNITIDGFTIVRSLAIDDVAQEKYPGGGGLRAEDSIQIKNCVFYDHKGQDLAQGVALYAKNATIKNSLFSRNQNGHPQNKENTTASAVYLENSRLQSSLIISNYMIGVDLIGDNNILMNNNILLNNVGLKMSENSTNMLTNNVIWKNYSGSVDSPKYHEIIGRANARNNAVQGQVFGEKGINLSSIAGAVTGPRFTYIEEDPTKKAYRNLIPDCFSPLLNTGAEVDLEDTTDMAMQKRVYGTAIDIGAFESQDSLLNAGEIESEGESICFGTIPTKTIGSITEKSGGKSTSKYLWYCNGIQIPNDAFDATYTFTFPLIETAVFTRWVYDDCVQAENVGLQSAGEWTVTVHPVLSLGKSVAQTICNGNSTTVSVDVSGGDENYTYQWFYKDSADGVPYKLIGETNAQLITPALEKIRVYYCEVSSCDQTLQSEPIVIRVYPKLEVLTQPTPTTLCYNGKAKLTTVAQGGNGSYVYQWQKKSNIDAQWENIANSDTDKYTTETLSSNMFFRCRLRSCSNDFVYTDSVLIVVNPKAVIDSISTDKVVCYEESTSLKVKVSGGNGIFKYQWEKASLGGNDWMAASGQTALTPNYTTETLTIPCQYRCKITSDCDKTELISSIIKLGVLPELRIVNQPKASDTLCYNTNADPLSISVDGGDGIYRYDWQEKHADGNWEVIQRSEDSTYTPIGKQKETRLFRCSVYSCEAEKTSTMTEIFVRKSLDAGKITDTSISICFGEKNPLIKNIQSPSGGTGQYEIKWAVFTDETTFIDGATDYEYRPEISEAGEYFFIRYVSDKTCTSEGQKTAGTFKQTINHIPLMNDVTDKSQILCVNDSSKPIIFSIKDPSLIGTLTYMWEGNQSSNGLPSSGEGNIPVFKAKNDKFYPDSLIVQAYPVLTNAGKACYGEKQTIKYTINALPYVRPVADLAICAEQEVSIQFSSSNIGGINSFAWSSSLGDNSTAYIGLPSDKGSGNINFTSANNQNIGQTTILTLIPSFTANGKTCVGATAQQKTMQITVNPYPHLISLDSIPSICSGARINYTPISNISRALFTWYRPALPHINNNVGKNGQNSILNDTLVNTDTIGKLVKYEYTIESNTCKSTNPYIVSTFVYPAFDKGSIGNSVQTLCNNTITSIQPIVTQAKGGNGAIFYEWREKRDTLPFVIVANTSNYTIPAKTVPGVYKYTRWVKNESCVSAWVQSTGEHTVTVLSGLEGNISVTSDYNGLHIEEPGANNGCAKIVVKGGKPPYTYLWNTNEKTDSIKDKAIGTYTVKVTDANTCTISKSITINPILFNPKIIADTSRFYVTYLGSGKHDGSSWENAFPNQILQYALDTAGKIAKNPTKYAEIWLGVGPNYVVEGGGRAIFRPKSTRKHSPFVTNIDDKRAKSFVIPAGVSLFGHFGGLETDKHRPNRTSFLTVLSGDLNATTSNTDDDAYNVVVFGDGVRDLEKPSYLNGVIIQEGNANHATIEKMQYGGGMIMVGNAVAQAVFLISNKAIHGAGAYMQGKSYLNSSLLLNNKAKFGGGIYTATNSSITNGPVIAYNTIVNNEADNSGAGVYLGENLRFVGNVLWNNKVNGISENNNIAFSSQNLQRYELAYVFANDSSLHLFDATCQILSNTNRDTLHNGPMFADPLNDMGASGPYLMGAFKLTALSPMLNYAELTQAEYSPQALRLDDFDVYGVQRKRGVAIDFNSAEYEEIITPKPTNNRLYVANTYRGKADGSSWSNAIGNFSAALEYFSTQTPKVGHRFEIWASVGSFVPTTSIPGTSDIRHTSFVLDGNTDLYGGFRALPGDEDRMDTVTRPRADMDMDGYIDAWEYANITTLSGFVWPRDQISSYHTIYRDKGDVISIIDGFKIVSGNADGNMLQDSLGGGLYTSKPMVIRNCAFLGNSACKTGSGAAIYAVNSLIDASYFALNFVSNTTLDTNLTTAVVAMDGGRIQNSIIQKNKTGGIIMAGEISPVISINNTIVGNTVGILNFADADVRIINTVTWDNKQRSDADRLPIQTFNGSFNVNNSAMDMNPTYFNGINNIELHIENHEPGGPHFSKVEDPNAFNNYRLDCLSPLINAGDTADWTNTDVDFANKPRIVEQVDIGAYETSYLSLQGGEIENTGEAICSHTLPSKTIGSISLAQGGLGTIQYHWYYNDTLIPEATEAHYLPTQLLSTDAVYTRRSLNDCGNEAQAQGSWLITVNPRPAASISGDADLDKGESTILQICFSGKAPFTYRITGDSTDRVHTNTDTLQLVVNPEDTVLYKLISVTDANGCEALVDSLTGEALVTVSDYVNIQSISSEGGTISLSKSGKMLNGTAVNIRIVPDEGYYLQTLAVKTADGNLRPIKMTVYADYEHAYLYTDFKATQDSNIVGIFALLHPWNREIEIPRFTKDSMAVLIYSPGELAYFIKQIAETENTYKNIHFKLMRHLDLGGVQDNTGKWNESISANWVALGRNIDTEQIFQGQFDGNNKQIYNLFIRTTQKRVGLFAHLGEGSTVKNLAIVSGSIKGGAYVGAFAGIVDKNASISQVFSMVNVEASESHAGGLVGMNKGIIEHAYTTGSVKAPTYTGGIAAKNEGKIQNTYSVAYLSGDSDLFGISSLVDGEIINSYFDIQMAGKAFIQSLTSSENENALTVLKFGLETADFDTIFTNNSLWKTSIDHYPALVNFDTTDVSELSVENIRLQTKENADLVHSDIILCKTHDLEFKILNDKLSVASINEKSIRIKRSNNADGFFTLKMSKGNISRYINVVVDGIRNSYTEIYDSICLGDTYMFGNRNLVETGNYYDTLVNMYKDDSIVTLHLVVIGEEKIEMNTELSLCSFEDKVYFDFIVSSGYPSSFSLHFDSLSKSVGFKDTILSIENNRVVVDMPDRELPPNQYTALLQFKNNANCPASTFNLHIKKGFDSKIMVQQKNNFMLYLKNNAYNGGYDFKSYQWLFDGKELLNETKSYYYSSSNLRTDGVYTVQVELMNSIKLEVCPIQVVINGQVVNVYPSNVTRGQTYTVSLVNFEEIPPNSQLKLFDIQGKLIENKTLSSSETRLSAPKYTGVYIIKVEIPNTEAYMFKIVVN